jgi:carbonic anhydrase/acetyltransferase-like protein (isoleucine patch superfamily)
MIQEFNGKKPQIHEGVYIAESAEVIGDVMIGRSSSIWNKAVLRGDEEPITIGENSNIQDACLLHTDKGTPLIIKDYVTFGHGVIAHGCIINSNCLIGMGAIVLNGAEIGENSIVAAGALVKENEKIPPKSLVVGVPGKVVRTLEDEDVEDIRDNALVYVSLSRKYLNQSK